MDRKQIFTKEWYEKNKNNLSRMYRVVKIPKKDGSVRLLEIPNPVLAGYQRVIYQYLSTHHICSNFADAYQKGKNARNVACLHLNKKLLMKLDIKNFFGSITQNLVKEKVFPQKDGAILADLCCCNGHLPQGACTSPIISNLVMKDFDEALGIFCINHQILYSRYSDDLIFSGDFNPNLIITKVIEMLRELNLQLNEKKTVVAGKGSRQMVLGIIVNKTPNAPSEYRRKIRQELYYCQKFGIKNHIVRSQQEKFIRRDAENNIQSVDIHGYLKSLLGKIGYCCSINPNDKKMLSASVTGWRLWRQYTPIINVAPPSTDHPFS